MNEPSNPLENRIPQTRQVSVLVTLELPTSFDTADWPSHIHLNGLASSACWGLLDQMLEDQCYVSVDRRPVERWLVSLKLPQDSVLDERFEELGGGI